MININVVFDFRIKKLVDGWVGGGGGWVGGDGWVVFAKIKDRLEPINKTYLRRRPK